MSQEGDNYSLTPAGNSMLEAFIEATMKMYPELSKEEALKKITENFK
jgi:hypothetical protein